MLLWDQYMEGYKSKVKLSVWAFLDGMSAERLANCENVQEYELTIKGYMSISNCWANSDSSMYGGGTMLNSKYTYFLLKSTP